MSSTQASTPSERIDPRAAADRLPNRDRCLDREHYIPIRRSELVELLCQQENLHADEADLFRNVAQNVAATLHAEFHQHLEVLKDLYASFDPDRVTARVLPDSLAPRDVNARMDDLFERFIGLLQRANYRRLSRSDIEAVLDVVSDWGVKLQVDLDMLDRLEVFARGNVVTRRVRRRPQDLYRAREVEIPTFQRLVVIFRVRPDRGVPPYGDDQAVYLKIFKNIPHTDLEMLLPGSRVKMGWHDRGRIALPTLTGLGIVAFKVLKGTAVLLTTGIAGAVALLVLVGGTLSYGLRSYHGYQKAIYRYQLKLSQSLYYQNLDNNAGVLFRLLDEAEEQECREALLAYYFLWRRAPAAGWNAGELARAVEAFLLETTGRHVDFEVSDALAKLRRFDLLREDDQHRLHARCHALAPPGHAPVDDTPRNSARRQGAPADQREAE